MDYLTSDDKLIHQEGVESLSLTDLQQATLERGLKVLEMTPSDLQDQLREWIKISLAMPYVKTALLAYAHSFEERDLVLMPNRNGEME
jgi:LETM1 and EF-hand domain-containing protein 1